MKIASAPGKVILFGEHSTVYPCAAVPEARSHYGIVAAIGIRNKVRATSIGNGYVEIIQNGSKNTYSTGSILDLRKRFRKVYEDRTNPRRAEDLKTFSYGWDGNAPLAIVLAEVMETYGAKGMRIEIKADVPRGSHLGSSSSTFAAVAAASLLECEERIYPQRVSELARLGDTAIVGSPSGIDDTAVSYGGLVKFIKEGVEKRRIEPLKIDKKIKCVVGNTKTPSKTGEVVGYLMEKIEKDRSFLNLLDQINPICDRGETALMRSDLPAIGKAMNENHRILRELGITAKENEKPLLDEICESMMKAGAYGAKMTGAGWGGCAIAVAEEPEKIVDALVAAGYEAFVAELGCEGVREEKEFAASES